MAKPKLIKQDECKDGYHKACPGGPARKGGIGILCQCQCHNEDIDNDETEAPR